MDVEFGRAKALDDITERDALAFPIWLWAWEVGLETEAGIDETWQVPVTSTRDVTSEFSEPVITLTEQRSGVTASASYSAEEEEIFGVAVWTGTSWEMLERTRLEVPVTFIAVPTIRGQTSVAFICHDLHSDRHSRAA